MLRRQLAPLLAIAIAAPLALVGCATDGSPSDPSAPGTPASSSAPSAPTSSAAPSPSPSPSPSTSPTAPSTTAAASTPHESSTPAVACDAADVETLFEIAGGAPGDPLEPVEGFTVQSGDFTFVAMRFSEPGTDNFHNGLWARGEGGSTYSVDEAAQKHTKWPAASKLPNPGTLDTPGAREALSCLGK